MISSKQTIALAGVAVLVLAVAGPILADILQAQQAQAFFRGGFGRFGGFGFHRGFGFGRFGGFGGFGGFPGWGWGGGWGGGCCGCGGWGW